MTEFLNQIRRIWNDDGRNDRDFSQQEMRLRTAQQNLNAAADSLKRASEALADYLKLHGLPPL